MRGRPPDHGEEGMRLGLRHAGMPRGTAVQLCLCLSVQSPCCAGAFLPCLTAPALRPLADPRSRVFPLSHDRPSMGHRCGGKS